MPQLMPLLWGFSFLFVFFMLLMFLLDYSFYLIKKGIYFDKMIQLEENIWLW